MPNSLVCLENTVASEQTSTALEQPSSKSSSSTTSNLLPFPQNTIVKLVDRLPPPDWDANFADEIQWLALEHPIQLRAIRYFVKQMIAEHRVPAPALVVEADTRLEYTHIQVNDPRALLAPAENRLGRYMGDVHAPHIMERYLKTLHAAKRKAKPQSHEASYNGSVWRVTVTPKRNRIVSTVTEHGLAR